MVHNKSFPETIMISTVPRKLTSELQLAGMLSSEFTTYILLVDFSMVTSAMRFSTAVSCPEKRLGINEAECLTISLFNRYILRYYVNYRTKNLERKAKIHCHQKLGVASI